MKYAAGGLVWRNGLYGPEMAIIYRSRHKDWTLPKGKLNQGESFGAAARREVREEIQCEAARTWLAGEIRYSPAGHDLKTVVFWSMRLVHGDPFLPSEEVEELRWMAPDTVVAQLSHPEEQRMVRRWIGRTRVRAARSSSQRERRLVGEVEIYRAELSTQVAGMKAAADANLSWIDEAVGLLDSADASVSSGDVDTGWRYFHAAQRLALGGMGAPEMAVRIRTFEQEAETDKITPWRRKAIQEALRNAKAGLESKEGPKLETVREALREALKVRHEASDNEYYRVELVRRQLSLMYGVAAGLVVAVLGASSWLPVLQDAGLATLAQIVLFGMLGAGFSAVISLAHTDAVRRIPEQIVNSWITICRPVLGAIAALAVYVFLHGGILNLGTLEPARMLAIAFVAGFVDQFVPRAAEAFASKSSKDRKDK